MPTRLASQAARPLARISASLSRLLPRRTEAKASAAGPLIALTTGAGQPVWTPRDYASFAREGVMQNAIVYRAVRMIAENAASVPLLLYERDAEIVEHPLLDLLGRPSPGMTGTDLLEQFYGFLLTAGNAYIEAAAVGGALRELHVLRPDRMKVIPGSDGWPEAYEYTVGGASVRIGGEPAPGVRPVLHMKLFHPADDHYGLSPIEAAASAIDLHNAAARWNKALLDNSARPSGALVYTSGQLMTAEQFNRLKEELEASFQGTRNAGRPLLLEGGLDWKSMSLTPRDLDFMEARHAAAREIALAIGVPPMLLGIPGDNTYANYAEANRAFWRQTVLPLVQRLARALGGWLAPAWGGELRLAPDLDAVEALSPEREALWARMERASFLTDAEKRAAVGIEYRNAPVYVGFMNLPDLVDQWQPTTRRAVARFERLAGVRLPDDYREFLLATNGGTPLVPDFEVPALAPKGRRSISFFHGLDSPRSGCDLRVAMELVRAHKTPRGLVPIAAAWLNTVFLDLRDGKCGVGYRDNRSMPLDCDWREHEFYRVADTFEGFLLGLRPVPPRRTRLRLRNGKVVLPRVNAYAPPTTKAAVARLERHMGVRLPRLYKEFLLHANGGRPLRPQFPIEGMAGNRSGGVENFFGVGSARWTDDLQQTFDWFRGGVPPGIVMIANCGECLYLCLDLRDDCESVVL